MLAFSSGHSYSSGWSSIRRSRTLNASSILRALILHSMSARSTSTSAGLALSRSSRTLSASSSVSAVSESAAGGERVTAVAGVWWKRMKKKALAAMTMQVVWARGARKEFRVWKNGDREREFLEEGDAGSFEEREMEALMEGNLNDDEEENCDGGRERKEREEDKSVGNGKVW
ncbi:hypothetical protein V8G54_021761 [Vigna mungo]|uniref:Uncharacterized protein n=1 Tax=Vigna mungo TaxID=3915 RepID=A0AAQ3NDU8_VIGMU